MEALEAMLQKEKDDRVESLDQQLEPINANIDKLYEDLDIERNARVQKEREILELLQEKSNQVEEAISIE